MTSRRSADAPDVETTSDSTQPDAGGSRDRRERGEGRGSGPSGGGRDRRQARRRSDLISREIRDELDIHILLRKAVASIARLLHADRVYVNLVESGVLGEILAEWRAPGVDPFWDPGKPPMSLTPLFTELASRNETLSLDNTSERDARSDALARHLQSLGIGAAMVTPLTSPHGFLGIVTTCHVSAHEWTGDEVRLADLASDEVGSALDLAHLFATQQDLVKQLQELDRSKSEFLSTVSHELRTPLTSIAGYVEMLIDGDAGPISEEQLRMLTIVGRNARRLRSLIEDLLTLSRIEVGAFRSRSEVVDLAEVISSACSVIEPSAKQSGINLHVDSSPTLGRTIGDAEQLERAVLNLLSNAVKFTQPGGNISVIARRNGEEIVVSIADSGMGIPKDELEQLFTRFFRASNATKRAIPGTGLGLTIVNSIIELHGGSIEVHSTVDVGTTFTIRLPASRPS